MNSIRVYKEIDPHGMRLLPAFDHNAETIERFTYDIGDQACYTILSPKGEVLSCNTGHYIQPHVFHAYSIVDEKVAQYPVHYIKNVRRLIDLCFRYLEISRLQITVRADQNWALGYAHAIGMECEGLLRKYGFNGVDMFMFAKVR